MSDQTTSQQPAPESAPEEELEIVDEGVFPYIIGAIVVVIGLAFGSIPFFWQGLPENVLNIRMNAKISDDLPWAFRSSMTLFHTEIGKQVKTFYIARSTSSETTKGIADFSVEPQAASIYVSKIECFCFREQELKPGEAAELPVVFFIDPEIKNDPDTKDLEAITFKYTFHRYKKSDES